MTYTEDAIDEAVDSLTRYFSVMSSIVANEEIYQLLKQGYKYASADENEDDVTVKIIMY